MAGDCWRGYRMEGSRIICGCWGPRWQFWLFFCCWDTEDEQHLALSLHTYLASFRRWNCGVAARTSRALGSPADRRGFRCRCGCVYSPALVPLPAGDGRDANAGIAPVGAGDRACVPRRLGWPEPADAGCLLHRGAHGGRRFLEQSEARIGLLLPAAFLG